MYNVEYKNDEGQTFLYLKHWVDFEEAEIYLFKWKKRYGENGHNPYPNGQGFYPFHSPSIVSK